MNYRFLSRGQASSICLRARNWLVNLQQNSDAYLDRTTEATFQIFVGLWICDRAFSENTDYASSRAYTQQVCQQIASRSDLFSDLFHAGPLLALISLGILRFFAVHDKHLEAFARNMSQLLQEHADHDQKEANELFLTRFLLHRLHLHPALKSYSLQERTAWDLLLADDLTMRSLATDIIAATRFGQAKVRGPRQLLQNIPALLPILALDCLRTYNLETAMLLLRCMRYSNVPKTRSLHTGLDFLVAQQQPCGKFGFFAREIARLPESTDNPEHDLKVYLPHTVSSLWTIAEIINPDFTLVYSF